MDILKELENENDREKEKHEAIVQSLKWELSTVTEEVNELKKSEIEVEQAHRQLINPL